MSSCLWWHKDPQSDSLRQRGRHFFPGRVPVAWTRNRNSIFTSRDRRKIQGASSTSRDFWNRTTTNEDSRTCTRFVIPWKCELSTEVIDVVPADTEDTNSEENSTYVVVTSEQQHWAHIDVSVDISDHIAENIQTEKIDSNQSWQLLPGKKQLLTQQIACCTSTTIGTFSADPQQTIVRSHIWCDGTSVFYGGVVHVENGTLSGWLPFERFISGKVFLASVWWAAELEVKTAHQQGDQRQSIIEFAQ